VKVFVINLDRNPDRLNHCVEQFSACGLTFERVAAVDGKMLSDEFVDGIKLDEHWPKPSKAEFGCFMSHRICWQNLLDSGEDFAAIFEDDVYLSNDAHRLISNSDWIPKYVSILKIETFNTKTYFDRWYKCNVLGRNLLKTKSFQPGTGGYIISRELARKFLNQTENYMPAPIDHYLFDPLLFSVGRDSIYQLFPAVCAQELNIYPDSSKLGSSIEDRSVRDMIRNKRGGIGTWAKILRETKKGLHKLKILYGQRRMVVPFK